MKLSSTLLGAIAVAKADDHPDLYGTCVKDEKSDRVLPELFSGENGSVEACLNGCRFQKRDDAVKYGDRIYGYAYAGLENYRECWCGDDPEGGFVEDYTWPSRCRNRCDEQDWWNCGGAGAMNVWSVPPSDLDGLCVYDYPRDERICNGHAEFPIHNLTPEMCKNTCFDKGFNYAGVEDGDSCYCCNDPDQLVPALPQECAMECPGDANEICGSAYRMNIYGPQFNIITPNHVVFKHATVFKDFQVNIDFKLDDNTANDMKANLYGLMVEGSIFPEDGSQVPAVFIQPNSMLLEVCMFLDGVNICESLLEQVNADQWYNLVVEQRCWGWIGCYVHVRLNDVHQFFWNITPEAYFNVDGIIGNTYNQTDIVAASGSYKDFYLITYEDASAIEFAVADEPDSNNAANA